MKLILHAGSHKTATTSIQHFCALNRRVLQKEGVHYPRNKSSSYVFNFLASDLAFDKVQKTKTFLEKAKIDAEKRGCHTVLISAESFYAMTSFFIDAQNKTRKNEIYFDNEKMLIESLKECCSSYESIDVAFYFRPQDDFANSLYNQFVKNVFGISYGYNKFIKKMDNVFDYYGHIKLWEGVFGKENIRVNNYLECKKKIVSDFCNKYISPTCYEKSSKKSLFSNTRLSRDVLEFKREFNVAESDRSLKYIAARCLSIISDSYPDQDGYQTYATYEEREVFFNRFSSGNRTLLTRYNCDTLPVLLNKGEPTYTRLTQEKNDEIKNELQRMLNHTKYKWELTLRRIANKFISLVPGGSVILTPVRVVVHRSRLLIEGW